MKRYTTLLLIFIISVKISTAQTKALDNNIIKYWHYRTRMLDNFISIGTKAGQSLPFGTRNEYGKKILSQGEGPILLGHYIGVLATEYKLLQKNNQNTEQTLKELYYALFAFNRLDLIAETSNCYNKQAKLDGFFVREDFPNNFVATNKNLNKNTLTNNTFIKGSGKTFTVTHTTHNGEYYCGKNPKGYGRKYTHLPMSLDQILGILMGVSLVNEMCEIETTYLDTPFQDGETSLKKEAKNIAQRLIYFAKKHHWSPREPDGDYIGDCEFVTKSKPNFFKNNATMYLFPRLISNIGKQIYGKRYGYLPLIDALGGLGSIILDNTQRSFYHRRMYIEMMALSNKDNNPFVSTAKKVKSISKKYNWEPFYYTLGCLLHDWKKDNTIKKQTLAMLSNAPFEGPFFHGVNDFAKNGWATEDRFTASLGGQYNGSRFPEITGNYIGLDYMLLHNMYLLTYANKTSSFGVLKNNKGIDYKHATSKIDIKKCVIGKKQSCKERQDYYKFLANLCKGSKEDCLKRTQNMYERKFGKGFKITNKKCEKIIFEKICREELKLNQKGE